MKDRLADLQYEVSMYVYEGEESTELHERCSSTCGAGVKSDAETSNTEQSLSTFLGEMSVLHADVRRIETLVIKVRRHHSDALLCAGTSKERARLNERLNNAVTELHTLSRTVKKRLAELQARCVRDKQNVSAGRCNFSAEMKIRQCQCSTLSSKFVDIMNEYLIEIDNYRDGCEERLTRQLKIMDVQLDDDDFDIMIETGNYVTLQQNILGWCKE